MMWFHVNAFRGIHFETHQVDQVTQKLFVGDSLSQEQVIITCGSDDDDNSMENVQKALQRMLVLGVIKDYTVDYSSREIIVKPCSTEPFDIQAKYALYYDTIEKGRRRGLREMVDAAAALREPLINDTFEKQSAY